MRWIIMRLAMICALSACLFTGIEPAFAAASDPMKAQQERRDLLIGTWFGETPPTAGGHLQWIIKRSRDGTYNIQFRIFAPNGRYSTHMETGIWGISGPVYFSATQGWRQGNELVGTDTAKARFYDAYEILALKRDLFEYRHYVTGTSYKVRKVGHDFKFPN